MKLTSKTHKDQLATKPSVKRVAIVGGGPGCISIYSELVRRYHADLEEINIFEPSGMMSSEAFSTILDSSITNTSVGISSLSQHDPLDLYRWLNDKDKGNYSPSDFIPRKFFKEYCLDRFDEAKKYSQAFGCQTTTFEEKVNSVDREDGQFVLTTGQNQRHTADAVILATGGSYHNPYPEYSHHKHYVENPYPEDQFLSKVKEGDHVLIIGTHLSGIDVCIGLLENRPSCTMTLVSPSGRLPAVKNEALLHPNKNFVTGKILSKQGDTLEHIYHAIHQDLGTKGRIQPRDVPEHDLTADIEDCKGTKPYWQDSIASIIDELNEVWSHLSEEEKGNFKKDAGRFVSEYIGAFPLCNAIKVLKGMSEGKVSLAKIDPKEFLSLDDQNHFVGRGSLEGKRFNVVVNATGMNRGFEKHLNLEKNIAPKNTSKQEGFYRVDASMKIELKEETLPIYAIGGQAKHSGVLVTNYIRALAVQAHKIGENIEPHIKGS